jgi:hypothetical protein
MLFERTVVVNNLLYGRKERQTIAHDVKLKRTVGDRNVNNMMHFSKKNVKRMKRNDYKKENDMPC